MSRGVCVCRGGVCAMAGRVDVDDIITIYLLVARAEHDDGELEVALVAVVLGRGVGSRRPSAGYIVVVKTPDPYMTRHY